MQHQQHTSGDTRNLVVIVTKFTSQWCVAGLHSVAFTVVNLAQESVSAARLPCTDRLPKPQSSSW